MVGNIDRTAPLYVVFTTPPLPRPA